MEKEKYPNIYRAHSWMTPELIIYLFLLITMNKKLLYWQSNFQSCLFQNVQHTWYSCDKAHQHLLVHLFLFIKVH